ncbi:Cyclin-dependent kinase f-4 [Thalictrum thalictroides]|uniref:Cyclin-dependent kinase f-4 n=1 Tax=Thalictrum thalictroides TaxID=46969 RepID=A0A7J6VFU5_THATH|nr:Cyclin-dependent kinase f-4 [Thalictrum thalictroides]
MSGMQMMNDHPSYLYSRYTFVTKIGEGSFGCVWKAFDNRTGEIVAIKVLKDKVFSWEEAKNLQEVKLLHEFDDPNIVKLKCVVAEGYSTLCLVFEYMDCSLGKVIRDRCDRDEFFTDFEIRNYCFQIFKGLDYMHRHGCFHCDLKPDNLLVRRDVIKIADLGSAQEIQSNSPHKEYITTRWYRAPEVLLYSEYGSAIDMWAMGAIMAELYLTCPLFPGDCGYDQLYKICSIMGCPDDRSWLGESAKYYRFPQLKGIPFDEIMTDVSKDAIDLMTKLLSWNPKNRPTAAEALRHPFFKPCYEVQTKPCLSINPPVVLGSTRGVVHAQ